MKPINSFVESLPVTAVLGGITYLSDLFLGIFYTDFELIALLLVAIIADAATALWKNKIRKNPITSLGIRQTIIKLIEYTVFILILTGIANVFGEYDTEQSSFIMRSLGSIVKDADAIGFFILIWTELVSISENMLDKKGAMARIINIIREKLANLFKKPTK